jgi:hypothetical protein
MSDWSKDAAAKYRQRIDDKNAKAAKIVSDRNLFAEDSRELWDRLRSEFKNEIQAFNTDPRTDETDTLTCDDSDVSILRISRKGLSRSTVLVYDSERNVIILEGPGELEKILWITAADGDELQLIGTADDNPISAISVVTQVLDAILSEEI